MKKIIPTIPHFVKTISLAAITWALATGSVAYAKFEIPPNWTGKARGEMQYLKKVTPRELPELVEERSPNQKADLIFISKSTRQLFLMKNGEAFKEYRISLGLNPTGSKLYKGDFRTPEGLYTISAHEPNSDYHKALRISYPDKNDIKRANDLSKSPGGDIMIHGETNDPGILAKILEALGFENYEDISNDFIYRFNWTRGCIAVRNNEVEEIYNAVKDGTKIWIQP